MYDLKMPLQNLNGKGHSSVMQHSGSGGGSDFLEKALRRCMLQCY